MQRLPYRPNKARQMLRCTISHNCHGSQTQQQNSHTAEQAALLSIQFIVEFSNTKLSPAACQMHWGKLHCSFRHPPILTLTQSCLNAFNKPRFVGYSSKMVQHSQFLKVLWMPLRRD